MTSCGAEETGLTGPEATRWGPVGDGITWLQKSHVTKPGQPWQRRGDGERKWGDQSPVVLSLSNDYITAVILKAVALGRAVVVRPRARWEGLKSPSHVTYPLGRVSAALDWLEMLPRCNHSLPHKVIHLVDQTSKNAPSTVSQVVEQKFAHAPAPAKPEAPVDSVLKDIATIVLSTFLLIGWVAFIITYPLVRLCPPRPSRMFPSFCARHLMTVRPGQTRQTSIYAYFHL